MLLQERLRDRLVFAPEHRTGAVDQRSAGLHIAAAGVEEVTKTWSEWKKAGYEVIHGSKALFGTELIWGSKGDGAIYKARFFGQSQVQEVTA